MRPLPPRLIFIWATPRSVSTAFAKSLSQIPDTRLEHEPFTDAYYFGPDRRNHRYDRSATRTSDDASSVSRHLSAEIPQRGTLLVKELAFQGQPYLSPDLAARATHIAITRHPARVYSSLVGLKPDFTRDEFGFVPLHGLLADLRTAGHDVRTVVDGDQLRARPAAVVSQVCRLLELPYSDDLLHWNDGRIRSWSEHEQLSQAVWHQTLESSHGLIPAPALSPADPTSFALPSHEDIYREALVLYARMVPAP